MANIKLEDILSLYRTPAKTEDPAIESRATLRRIIKTAGPSFPLIKTSGFLTDIALPEKMAIFTSTWKQRKAPTPRTLRWGLARYRESFRLARGKQTIPELRNFDSSSAPRSRLYHSSAAGQNICATVASRICSSCTPCLRLVNLVSSQ